MTETDLARSMFADAPRGLRVVETPDADRLGATLLVERALVVGRTPGPEAGAAINDPRMSAVHFKVTRVGKPLPMFELADLHSKNGTCVNGQKVASRYLEDGAVVRAGSTVMLFGPIPDPQPVIEHPFVGLSAALGDLIARIDKVAPSDLTVLISGPSGTGKELAAQRIHDQSGRKGPFRAVNCAALPMPLVESLLFGHRKGSFTGADQNHVGHFQEATNGTLFLDEVGELPLEVQPKLLRVLESREFNPVGSTTTLKTNARIVAATNRDLEQESLSGAFRLDLRARLYQFPLSIPALRERREDVMPIARSLLHQIAPDRTFQWAADAVEALLLHDWPMNVRELRTVMQMVATLEPDDGVVRLTSLPPTIRGGGAKHAEREPMEASPPQPPPSRSPSREAMTELMARCGGNVAQVAKILGKDRKQVYRWLAKHGLAAESYRDEEP